MLSTDDYRLDRFHQVLEIVMGWNNSHFYEIYQKSISLMEEAGIEVRYFDVNVVGEERYDFLYLHDEKIILKWYSSQTGKSLSGFSVAEKQEEEVIERWKELYALAEDRGDPFTKIPNDREF